MGGQNWMSGILCAVGVLSTAGVANAYVPLRTTNGTLVRWWNPALTFKYGSSVPEEVDNAAIPDLVVAAMDQWVDTSCGLVPETTYAGTSPATAQTNPNTTDPDNVIVFIRTASAWAALQRSQTELAITLVARIEETGQLVDADIAINDAGHKFTLAGEPAPGEVRLQTMLVHETGHFFGLDHSVDADAVMNASYNIDHDTLIQDDIDGACFMYTDVPPLPVPKVDDGGGCEGAKGGLMLGLAGLGLIGLGRARRVGARR